MEKASDREVFEIAQAFATSWNDTLRHFPLFQLDFTWPSIGTLDLITSPLRRHAKLSRAELELVLGAACYIAQIALACWNTFPVTNNKQNETKQNEFSLRLTKGENPDVILAVESALLLKDGERYSLTVNQILRRILRSNAIIFEALPHHFRQFDPEENYLNPLALGIMLGLCPYGKGPWSSVHWADERLTEFSPQIASVTKLLAASSAAFYARNFPDEPLGQSAELYELALIFPPPGVDEQIPYSRGVERLLRYLSERRYQPETFPQLFANLAQFPDSFISNIGFICGSALVNGEPAETLQTVALSKTSYAFRLRPALLAARLLFGLPGDPLDALERGDSDVARRMLTTEKHLGFTPLLTFIDESLSEPWLLKVIESLCCFNPEAATRELEAVATTRPLPTDVLFEWVQLDIAAGRTERARENLRAFRSTMTELARKDEAGYLLLLGRLALAENDLESASDAFQLSHLRYMEIRDDQTSSFSRLTLSQSSMLAAGALIQQGDTESALLLYQDLHATLTLKERSLLGYVNALLTVGDTAKAFQLLESAPAALLLRRELFQAHLNTVDARESPSAPQQS